MGWIHDSADGEFWHEATVLPEFPDGTRGTGTTLGRIPDDQVIVKEHWTADEASYETRPAAECIGWRIVCDCSFQGAHSRSTRWVSDLFPRVPSPKAHRPEAGRFWVADGDVAFVSDGPLEEAFLAAWHRLHLVGKDSLIRLEQAQAAVKEAETQLREAVATARHHGASWEAVGQATGVSRQAAHERWAKLGED